MTEKTTQNSLIIDCDTGRDDALAIWLSILRGQSLVGVVCSYGNTSLANAAENSQRVLALAGRNDIPVYVCAQAPLKNHVGFETVVISRQKISGNGLCNVDLPVCEKQNHETLSPEVLAERVVSLAQTHGKLDYVIIGPATNFASICQVLGQDIHLYIRSVTMMGAKLDALWRELPGADFNVMSDPYAIKEIFETGCEIQFVPMDVTWPIEISLAQVEALVANTSVAEYSKRLMIEHCRHFAPTPVFKFHDPSVVIAIEAQERFKNVHVQICLDEESADFGRVTLNDNGDKAKIFQPESGYEQLFIDRILTSLGFSKS
ncbi:MAG: nucleoside hydrolase [Alphaproteobacteria bacterium]|nr:nucleoside hydrolase [Alphaproteobacteria bacterium]